MELGSLLGDSPWPTEMARAGQIQAWGQVGPVPCSTDSVPAVSLGKGVPAVPSIQTCFYCRQK